MSAIANTHPDFSLRQDFRQKGTISNMAQSVNDPQGRLWTTSLALASILLTASM